MLFISSLLALLPASLAIVCPPFLPTVPISSSLGNTTAIANLTSTLRTTFDQLTTNVSLLGNSNNSFSLDVYSLTNATPLFTYHFTGANLRNATYGVCRINSSTIYRVGSVTKVITLYTYLKSVGAQHWNDPITNFIPELAAYSASHAESSPLDIVRWNEITIGQLASQLSGIARGTSSNPLREAEYKAAAGLPALPTATGRLCNDTLDTQYSCTRNDTFTNLLLRHPVHAPGTTPIYSNIAYQLIAYALENITSGESFDQMVDLLISTLALSDSYYPLANESTYERAIIPFSPTISGYDTNMLSDSPSGAFYSTIDDMRIIGQSILSNSILPANTTQFWLKPHAFTFDSHISVGAPWETTQYPPSDRFPVEIITKAGDVGLYSAIMALIPEYGVGFTVLAAGDIASPITRFVADEIIAPLIPALKKASYEISLDRYAGQYCDPGTNSAVTLSLTPPADDEAGGRPVLQLSEWTYSGTSIIAGIGTLLGIPCETADFIGLRFILYPTGLSRTYPNGTKVESWRAAFATKGNDAITGRLGTGVFSSQCETWTEVDGYVYGGVSFDEFLLEVDAAGSVAAVKARVLRQGFWDREGEGEGRQNVAERREEVRMERRREG